jgi:hypothetical protein
LTVQILSGFAFGEATKQNEHYTDLNGHWAEETIRGMIAEGYIKGELSEGRLNINPDRPITRAEFVVVLAKVKEYKTIAGSAVKFSDVEPSSWYYEAIEKASGNGAIHGYLDGSFGPQRFITRAEASSIMTNSDKLNTLDNLKKVGTKFSDIDESSWYYNSVMLCRLFGIIKGYPDGSFRPTNNITRAEAFAMIDNSKNKKEIPTAEPEVTPTPIPVTDTVEEPEQVIPDSSASSADGKIVKRRDNTKPSSSNSPTPSKISTPTLTPTATMKPTPTATLKPTPAATLKPTPTQKPTQLPTPTLPLPGDEEIIVELTDFIIFDKGISLLINEEYTLKTDFEPFAATDKEVIWSSEDAAIASVDSNGKVTAISEGTTRITGKTRSGSIEDSCRVTVETDEIVIDSIDVDKTMLEPNETATINVSAYSKTNSTLFYDCTAEKGTVTSSVYESVYTFNWIAPDIRGIYSLNLTISDEQKKSIERELEFSVGIYHDSFDRDRELPPEGDFDNDGLTNAEEIALGTNPRDRDTDSDGLSDYDELIYKTSPLKKDSDGDEIYDGAEIIIGTNPLIPDEQQIFEISKSFDKADIVLSGSGNNALSTFEKCDNKLFYAYKGLIGDPFELETPERINGTKISVSYDKAELIKYGAEEKDLKIYTYRYETGRIEKMQDINVDEDNSCITAKAGADNSGKTVFFLGKDDLYRREIGDFNIVFALDMSENMKNTDEECIWKESLTTLVDTVSDGSEMSVVQSVYNNMSDNVEVVEEMTDDKIIVRYGINDLMFKLSPGQISPVNMFDKAFETLLAEDDDKGRVVVAVLAGCTDEEYELLAQNVEAAKLNNIVVNIVTTSQDRDAIERMKQLTQIGNGSFILIPLRNVAKICISDMVREFKELNNTISLNKPESIVTASYSSAAAHTAVAAAVIAKKASTKTTSPVVTINGFDFSKHTYSIQNKANNIYTASAHCAGIAMSAQMNFLGLLPSIVEISSRDEMLDDDSDSFNYGTETIAYDLVAGLEYERILDKNVNVLTETVEVNKMFDYWWVRRNYDLDSYRNSFISKSSFFSGNYLTTGFVNSMCSSIDSDCPIYIGIGNNYNSGGIIPDIDSHYHGILAYDYQKTYDDGELCKVELGIYDSNWPGDTGRKLILTRNKGLFGNYKNEWGYEYVFQSPRWIYTSNEDFNNGYAIRRDIEFFNMELYREMLLEYFSYAQRNKVTFKEDYMGTEIVVKLPEDKVDSLRIYDIYDGKGNAVDEKFKKDISIRSGNFAEITLESYKLFNQIVVATGSEFVENEIGYEGSQWIVNMQDVYPDVFVSPYTNFPDIVKDYWCLKEIKAMKSEGVILGYPDGKFYPDRTITRAEYIKMVLQVFGVYQNQADSYKSKQYFEKYKDLKGHWAAGSCALVLAEGWYKPSNEFLFEPNKPITREECAGVLWKAISSSRTKNVKALIKNDTSNTRYNDNGRISEEYISAVAHLDINKIMTGYTNNMFLPEHNMTRAEVCKVLVNARIK